MRPIAARQLQELVDSHGAALVLYARQWCSYPDDALQEALMDLSQLSQAPSNPVAWLFRAVRFKAMNFSRSERRRDHYQRKAAQQRDAWFEHDPTDALQSDELEAMLAELEPLDREIVVAKVWGMLSFAHIAELVGSSESTVHRRYQKALQLLGTRLDGKKTGQKMTGPKT